MICMGDENVSPILKKGQKETALMFSMTALMETGHLAWYRRFGQVFCKRLF